MGPSWRDMDPEGFKRQLQFANRLRGLREKLQDMPLSNFTVADLRPLHRVMNPDLRYINLEDLDHLEQKLEQKVSKKP